MRKAEPMRSTLRLPGALLLALSLSLASGCASRASRPSLPTADLVAPAKPQLSVAAVESGDAAALDLHNSAIEAWGDALAAQVGRVCRAAVRLELAKADCPKP
jgi:hypothetical protein